MFSKLISSTSSSSSSSLLPFNTILNRTCKLLLNSASVEKTIPINFKSYSNLTKLKSGKNLFKFNYQRETKLLAFNNNNNCNNNKKMDNYSTADGIPRTTTTVRRSSSTSTDMVTSAATSSASASSSVDSEQLPSPGKDHDGKNIIRVNNITKSQQDTRDYRGLELPNGLKVVLVSDPQADKAAASISVNVGHFKDPDHLSGLAHFLEHMLFLGTLKYPNENAYSTYLQEYGGQSNAMTGTDSTKYYFDVLPAYLDGALDRFTQFFISPLFTESATDREINAVHSEHSKNLSVDSWRIRSCQKIFTKSNHPFSKFSTGNKETLQTEPKRMGVNVRNELIAFHSEWYSANIMNVCVVGKNTLDELEAMVIPKFSQITNKNVTLPVCNELPYTSDSLQKKIYIIPIKDTRTLNLSFQCANLDQYYKAIPEQYLSHLLGHEGRGSVLSELKNNGWCDNLVAGHATVARHFGFFDVTVDLTEEGLNKIDEIIEIIFQYIKMLQQEEPKKWIFDEYRKMMEIQFRYKEKEQPMSMALRISEGLDTYPIDEILSAPYLISEWRPDLIKQLVNEFTPDRCRITIVAQNFKDTTISTENIYGAKYHCEDIPKELIGKWTNCELNGNLKLPEPNPFIPTDFALYPIELDTVEKFPKLLFDTPVMRVWFKQDTQFLKPKTFMNFDFCSPLAYSDPLNCVLTQLFVSLFKDDLTEYLYAADLASLRINVTSTANGISLSISGYTQKQQLLTQKILDHLFGFKFNEKRFHIMKAQMLRTLKNHKIEQPYLHTIYFIALLLMENAWSKDELIDAIALMTPERLTQHINDFLSRVHVEAFIYGNCNRQRAIEITNIVEQKMNATNALVLPLLSRQLQLKRELKLERGKTFLYEVNNNYHTSSCVQLYLQFGVQSDRSHAFLDLIVQMLDEPFYNTLRTQEQLGYIVHCSARKANSAQGLRVIVQSAKHPIFVMERIESFLNSRVKNLEELTDEEFQRHRDTLVEQKLEKPKRLSGEYNQYLAEILVQQYHFERNEKEVEILKTITKSEVIAYYKDYVMETGAKRQGIYIYIVSTTDDGAGTKFTNILNNITKLNTIQLDNEQESSMMIQPSDENGKLTADDLNELDAIRKYINNYLNMTKVNDLSTFKATKELFPIIQPFIDILPKGGKCKL